MTQSRMVQVEDSLSRLDMPVCSKQLCFVTLAFRRYFSCNNIMYDETYMCIFCALRSISRYVFEFARLTLEEVILVLIA